MGAKDLSKELRSSSKLTSRLSDFNGKIVGVDTFIWLNKAIFSSPEIGTLFHQLPQVSLGHQIGTYFDRLLAVFDSNSLKALFVLDGASNPLKAATNEQRKKKSSEAFSELSDLIKTGDQEQLKKITALKRRLFMYVKTFLLNSLIGALVEAFDSSVHSWKLSGS